MSDKGLLFILLIVIVVCAVFEVTLLAISFFYADEIECNWLWCTFKTSRSEMVISQECYMNGEQINCSSVLEKVHT